MQIRRRETFDEIVIGAIKFQFFPVKMWRWRTPKLDWTWAVHQIGTIKGNSAYQPDPVKWVLVLPSMSVTRFFVQQYDITKNNFERTPWDEPRIGEVYRNETIGCDMVWSGNGMGWISVVGEDGDAVGWIPDPKTMTRRPLSEVYGES